MSSIVSRLILALSFMASIPMVYFVIFFVVEETMFSRDRVALWVTDFVCFGYVTVGWILVWIWQVRWTALRAALTSMSLGICLIPAGLVFMVFYMLRRSMEEPGIIFGGMAWAICWFACTAFIWRETAGERALRLAEFGVSAIACPRCGYNMTGLQKSVCPECGTGFTLDQLYAGMRSDDPDIQDTP